MKRIHHILQFFSFLLLLPILTFAQGTNDSATFQLDFLTDESDTQTTSVINEAPVINDSNQFTVTLVLQGATNLIGVNCDLSFDNSVLQVVAIQEIDGDINFDGRSNIADVRVMGERFNESTTQNGYSYFNRNSEGESAQIIDILDVQALLESDSFNNPTLFWTQNENSNADDPIRESVEIFQDPADSNNNGVIDDIVVVLLPRIHPDSGFEEGFGFDGDARIADITFEIIDPNQTSTTIEFSDVMAIDEQTEITTTEIVNASTPSAEPVTITLQ